MIVRSLILTESVMDIDGNVAIVVTRKCSKVSTDNIQERQSV